MTADIAKDTPAVLNVLDLGAKNDGSEDVSGIVNRYTGTNALYFPPGRYLCAEPLVIVNPVIGAGYARSAVPDDGHTWLISAIGHDDADPLRETGVIRFGGAGRFSVENLNILCHSRECGIYINPCVQATAVFIDRVGIFNTRGYGLCAAKGDDVPGFASRPLFLGNMTIHGATDYPDPSVGIYAGGRIGDNRLSGIEIMGTRVGLWLEASVWYADNMHIWTRGIVLGHGDAIFLGSNIYVDTAFSLFEFRSAANALSIYNFMSWEDGSTGGCTRHDARVFSIPVPLGAEPSVDLTDGLVYVSGREGDPGRLADLTFPGVSARVRDVRLLTDWALTSENWRRFTFTRCGTPHYRGCAGASERERYVLFAAVVTEAENGAASLRYTDSAGGGAVIELAKRGTASAARVTPGLLGGADLFEESDGRMTKLYARVGPGPGVSWAVDTLSASADFFPLDLGLIKRRRDYAGLSEILSPEDARTRLKPLGAADGNAI